MRFVPLALLLLAASAPAQVGPAPRVRLRHLPAPQPNLLREAPVSHGRQAEAGTRPVIMLTGYWHPTSAMVAAFSQNPALNPSGWIGSNWEGRGYDVISYFADYSGGGPQGSGDLEVDYQDTSADFWPLADGVDPVAVVTFSRGLTDNSWEVEYNQRNLLSWIPDYTAPLQPTPAPPDGGVPTGHVRISTLPVQELVDYVDLCGVGVSPYVNFMGNGGGFLSEFIAYHGVWYQALHQDPQLPDWCLAGGHVHVGGLNNLLTAKRATKATLRRLIHYVDGVLDAQVGTAEFFCPPVAHSGGIGGQLTMTGSVSLSRNDLVLLVDHAVQGQFGFLFYGPSAAAPSPLGDGRLCVGGTLTRVLPAAQPVSAGHVELPLDLAAPPFSAGQGAVAAGSAAYFQYWMRDPSSGGAGSNTSSALGLVFLP